MPRIRAKLVSFGRLSARQLDCSARPMPGTSRLECSGRGSNPEVAVSSTRQSHRPTTPLHAGFPPGSTHSLAFQRASWLGCAATLTTSRHHGRPAGDAECSGQDSNLRPVPCRALAAELPASRLGGDSNPTTSTTAGTALPLSYHCNPPPSPIRRASSGRDLLSQVADKRSLSRLRAPTMLGATQGALTGLLLLPLQLAASRTCRRRSATGANPSGCSALEVPPIAAHQIPVRVILGS